MNSYAAILRGVNVTGYNKLKMSDLRQSLEDDGFKEVSTYIQSGNIIFKSPDDDPYTLSEKIENLIQKRFGMSVPAIVLGIPSLRKIYENNPFLREGKVDESKLYVTFLATEPSEELIRQLSGKKFLPEEYIIKDREIYLHCPDGYGRTKINNNYFESKLKVSASTRNWRTVGKLVALGEG